MPEVNSVTLQPRVSEVGSSIIDAPVPSVWAHLLLQIRISEKIKNRMANSINPDEPSHLDLAVCTCICFGLPA